MKLLIENAREGDNCSQYILITPQNISHIEHFQGPDMRITRMLPPERGQGRINFQPVQAQ